MLNPVIVSIGIIIAISFAVIYTALKKVPGIGIFISIAIIGVTLWLRKNGLAHIGVFPPKNGLATILASLGLGLFLCLFSNLAIEPLLQRWTHKPLDYSAFEKMRQDWKQLLLMVLVSWVLAAFLEETIFRGFMITEISSWFGTSSFGILLSIVVGSVVFGLAHWYQGQSSVVSTGIIGAWLAVTFVLGGYNLWLPILTHGFIDTFGLVMMYLKWDQKLVAKLWKNT